MQTMIHCPNCGHLIPSSTVYCPRCGATPRRLQGNGLKASQVIIGILILVGVAILGGGIALSLRSSVNMSTQSQQVALAPTATLFVSNPKQPLSTEFSTDTAVSIATDTRSVATVAAMTDTPATAPSDTPTTKPTNTPAPTDKPTSTNISQLHESSLKIVFARGDTGCSILVVREVGHPTEVTFRQGNDNTDPSWSPNGTQFVASSGECGASDHSLVVFTPISSRKEIIVSGGNNIDPDWGSDGLIYYASGSKDGGDIRSVNPDGTSQQNLGLYGRQPTLSPDGRYLAFMRRSSTAWRIWISSKGSRGFGPAMQLDFPAVQGGIHARMPNWTSDSKFVVFNVTDGNYNSVALGSVEIETNNATSTAINTSSGPLARPACSKHGNLCIANGRDSGLWLITESGGTFIVGDQITSGLDWGANLYP